MGAFRAALRRLRRRLPLVHHLEPAWFDEGRFIIQTPEFERLTANLPFRGRVLNAGCGEGLYACFLEGFGDVSEIVNMDLSQPVVAAGRQDPRHRDVRGSLTELPFESGAFDACLCSEVLEHIPDDGGAASELARCIKGGGLLLVSVPTPPAPKDENHVREGYTFEEIERLLIASGFEILSRAYCMHGFSRLLYSAWQAQNALLGRNLFPRAAVRGLANLDRSLQFGRPWNLVVLARRQMRGAGA